MNLHSRRNWILNPARLPVPPQPPNSHSKRVREVYRTAPAVPARFRVIRKLIPEGPQTRTLAYPALGCPLACPKASATDNACNGQHPVRNTYSADKTPLGGITRTFRQAGLPQRHIEAAVESFERDDRKSHSTEGLQEETLNEAGWNPPDKSGYRNPMGRPAPKIQQRNIKRKRRQGPQGQ